MQNSHPSNRISAARRTAAHARWDRRQIEPDLMPQPLDVRQPFALPLSSCGGQDLHIEPCIGRIAWRAVDPATGRTVARAALKTLLRQIADGLPRTLSIRAL